MSDYDEVRLETLAGVVVAYFAPVATVETPGQNDLHTVTRSSGRAPIARDRRRWKEEVHIFGTFLTEDLPADHVAALTALLGGAPTIDAQLNRIHHYAKEVGGSFRFYNRGRSYTADNESEVNYLNGVWPVVTIADFKETYRSGVDRVEFFLKLVVGLPRAQ